MKKPLSSEYNSIHSGAMFLAAIAVVLLIQVIVFVLEFAIAGITGSGFLHHPIASLIVMIFLQLGFAAAAIIVSRAGRVKFFRGSKFRKMTPLQVLIAALIPLVCFFGFLLLMLSASTLLQIIGFSMSGIPSSTIPQLIIAAIVTIIFAGICEELVFRGGVMWGIRNDFGGTAGKWLTILLSGFAFSIMHMNPAQTVYQFLVGAVMAYMAIELKNIVPAIIIHAGINAIAMSLSIVLFIANRWGGGGGYPAELPPPELSTQIMLFVITGVIGVIVAAIALAIIFGLVYLAKWLGKRKWGQNYYDDEPIQNQDAPSNAFSQLDPKTQHTQSANSTSQPHPNAPQPLPSLGVLPSDSNLAKRNRRFVFWILYGMASLACLAVWGFALLLGMGILTP